MTSHSEPHPTPARSTARPEPEYARPGEIFAGAAGHYAASRPPYPDALIDRLEAFVHRFPGGRVLDLGTGPGVIALALAARGIPVTAVDPSTDMLDEGRRQADQLRIRGIEWTEGSSYALPPVKDVCLTIIGDAFHWMVPRAATLASLDRLIVRDGAVALLSRRWHGEPKLPWEPVLRRVRERHLGTDLAAGPSGEPSRREAGTHEQILAASPFPHTHKESTDYELRLSVDQLVAWQFSHAQTSVAALGDRREAYEADLRRELLALEPAGVLQTPSRAHLLIAARTPWSSLPGGRAR
ncbi:class I SAM-dependent methyltransferase [Kitasatospora sp. NPDC059327]|uniref:class I SAM-dependent methyltransferase n=1 Tax=Kitasatospora sp. NPDC059327 TaxID=3346803 RepID=UPI0036B6E36C